MKERIFNILQVTKFKYPWVHVSNLLLKLDPEIMEDLDYKQVCPSFFVDGHIYAHKSIAFLLRSIIFLFDCISLVLLSPRKWLNKTAKPVEFKGKNYNA